jgi:signal transduction histidine kinase/ligand-binding sensor domain-containing protein
VAVFRGDQVVKLENKVLRHYFKSVSTPVVCRYFIRLLAGLLCLAATTAGAGQIDSTWYERSWQSGDGLPDNSVSGIAQTPDGYLWVATAGGLKRFDGVRFQEEFPLTSLDGVPEHVVRAMFLDRQGRIWLGMDRGPIVCIAPGNAQVFTNVPDARAAGITEDSDGAIWVTYVDGGLTQIKNGRVTVFNNENGWHAIGTAFLASDNDGRLWFANRNQVGIYQDGKFQTLVTLQQPVRCIGRRREGGIWICIGRRLMSYEEGGEPQQFCRMPAEPNSILGTVLFESRDGAVWVGTGAHGLFRCAGTNAVQMPTSSSEITCLTQDREGNLWVGTDSGGLDRLRPRIIELLGTDTGLPYESVRSVCEDASGAIWVATRNGILARWQNNTWGILPEETNEPAGNFSCVAADPKGGLWIGTRDHGFYHLQDGKYQNWRQVDGLSSDDVRSIMESSNGDLFVATDTPSRLQRLHDGTLRALKAPSQTRSIRALTQDAAGRVWVASADGRLLRVDGDQLLDETPNITNRLASIRCLYATEDGSLWIGYAGWGLGCLKDGNYSRISTAQGLYDDYVSQMVADDRGWLWCAGNHGVFEMQLDQLRETLQGKARVHSITFSRGEGFANLQPTYENVPGAMRSRDGRLWFPMYTGLAVVHPDRVPVDMPPPPVLVERAAVDGQTVGLYDRYLPPPVTASNVASLESPGSVKLRLPPNMHQLDFEFTALSFTLPENVEFQYRLKGLDDNWSGYTTTRNVSYTRLSHGDYSFEVRACNIAGTWDPDPVSLSFEVTPFYWQTWWFRLSILAAFTAGVVAVVRYVSFQRLHHRLQLLEQQAAVQKERARIAKDIHDDLGADLTQIAFLGELAQQDRSEPEKVAERIGTISSTARQAVKSLDEIVWAVNPRNDTLPHLIDYAGQFAVDYLRPTGIRCRLDFPEQIPPRQLSTNLRHNLFLVIKEALHNIVKHAGATEIWLRVDLREEMLEMVIEDNGRGFAQAPDNALADGLRNMRQRLAEIGGECRVESQLDSGTRVILRLPWQKD